LDRIGQKFIDRKIAVRVVQLRYKAKKGNLPFDLTAKYLIKIFPTNCKCPALGTEFNWFGEYNLVPTVDRIIPERGYTKGNVVWVSQLANLIMSSAHPSQVIQVGKFAEKIFKKAYPEMSED
tara:strand:- start:287 stop:652 length:366 start_codon:yes stop_codon:yes gene_type:complete